MNETEKDRIKAADDIQRRLAILKEDMWQMDVLAGEYMEEKGEIQTDIAPKLAAIQNIDYKLTDICTRKGQALVQYRMGVRVLEGLEAADDITEGMEVC